MCFRALFLSFLLVTGGYCVADSTLTPDVLWQTLLDTPPTTSPADARQAALRALDDPELDQRIEAALSSPTDRSSSLPPSSE